MTPANLTLQDGSSEQRNPTRIVVLGEVLWDVFPDSVRLGGAPLNFAVHASRLGFQTLLVSAVGDDELGRRAQEAVKKMGLDTSMLQTTARWQTGTASVHLDPSGHPAFQIPRPAAYDAAQLTEEGTRQLTAWSPEWLYHGTLFPSQEEGKSTLLRLLQVLPDTMRFYDVNLRPGFDSPELVAELLAFAHIVKLNEAELRAVSRIAGLPSNLEAFCRAGVERYGWRAVCVTLGEHGCAILAGNQYLLAGAHRVEVADTVGAGDAFAAAFLHGLSRNWALQEVAAFANRVGGIVASRPGAIPDWDFAEAADPLG
jgi:fructokinase